ncbi:35347_t:CDS:2, partial [Racocetra persica]
MATKISQLRIQIRSLQKQLQQFQKYFSKGTFSYQQRHFIQCCQFFDRLPANDLISWPLDYFCRECRKRLRLGLRKKRAKFPGEITTDKLRNYFRQQLGQYDPASLQVQKIALHSYLKFSKLPIDWEKLARIIPSSQRKFFATINEQDLAQLKAAKVEKNPRESLRVHGKGNKVRFVLLPETLTTKIHPYRKGYLFTSQRGKPIKAEYIRWLLKSRTQQAGIKKRITPHTFRRSFATLLHNRGAHLTSIQRLL